MKFCVSLELKNGSQFFLEEKMKQVAELDLLEVVGTNNLKICSYQMVMKNCVFFPKRLEGIEIITAL